MRKGKTKALRRAELDALAQDQRDDRGSVVYSEHIKALPISKSVRRRRRHQQQAVDKAMVQAMVDRAASGKPELRKQPR
jgi:hypothetical protein